MKLARRFPWLATMALVALVGGGCAHFLYAKTGEVMGGYAKDYQIPYLLESRDVGAACMAGDAFSGFIASFGAVTATPHMPAMMSYMSAGMCAERASWDADLRYLRAMRADNPSEARDAEIVAGRDHKVAAMRYYQAFKHWEAAFGPKGHPEDTGATCPKLTRGESFYFVIGLTSGLLAVMHNMAAQGAAGVPMSIPAEVARAARCVDAKRWWGVPWAVQAAVWLTVPGSAPKGVNPWTWMDKAVAAGDAAGVRLARSFQVQLIAALKGHAALEKAIAAHAAQLAEKKPPKKYRLLDVFAGELSRYQSDRIWTQLTGHRTPNDQFGKFPDDKPAGGPAPGDDILNGLGE